MGFVFDKIDDLSDAYLITPFFSSDARGSFEKIFEASVFNNSGLDFVIKESFVSISQKNVIRGLHFQYNNPQSKIVTVLKGSCQDVIVDLRKNSKTYLNYRFFMLNDINHKALYIPKGYAHGFLSLTDDMCMIYYCDQVYDRTSDTGIIFNDKTLNVKWPISNIEETIHSDRDMKLMTFDDFEKMKIFWDL